jgi:5-methylcytosine-specific restriction endonuclease McrA
MNLSSNQRAQLRMMFGGKCAYCGCDLPEKGWHADHVEPVLREWWKRFPKVEYTENPEGGFTAHEVKQVVGLERPANDKMENLFPSCASCNLDKHAMSVESWRKSLAHKVEVCRYDSAFRHAERFGLIQEIKKPIVFHFETYAALVEGEKQ